MSGRRFFSKENAVQEAKSAYEAHKRAYEDLVESCELAKAQVEMFASHYDKNREELKKATQEVQLFDIEARKHDWYGGNINEVRPENLFLAKLPWKEILYLLEKDIDGDFEQELQGMTLDQMQGVRRFFKNAGFEGNEAFRGDSITVSRKRKYTYDVENKDEYYRDTLAYFPSRPSSHSAARGDTPTFSMSTITPGSKRRRSRAFNEIIEDNEYSAQVKKYRTPQRGDTKSNHRHSNSSASNVLFLSPSIKPRSNTSSNRTQESTHQ